MEPVKDPSDEASESSSGLLSANLNSYLDELVGKILDDNQIMEERIMAHMDSVVRKVKKVGES